LTDSQWQQYEEQGYLKLGHVLSDADLSALQERIDAIMLGEAPTDLTRLMMQLDSTDGKNAGPQTRGHKGATLAYRKIQNLEIDEVFRAYMERPEFRRICDLVCGEDTPIASFRAMFMNKPARQGTLLGWHQDRWTQKVI
jgi:phytanoyl-CoA hydroxylase